jgi:hypothetical protein
MKPKLTDRMRVGQKILVTAGPYLESLGVGDMELKIKYNHNQFNFTVDASMSFKGRDSFQGWKVFEELPTIKAAIVGTHLFLTPDPMKWQEVENGLSELK